MSKIKELKSNNENNLNLIDVIELFGFEKKSKYTETLLRLMKNTKSLKEHVEEIKTVLIKNFPFIEKSDLDKFNDIQLLLVYRFIDSFLIYEDGEWLLLRPLTHYASMKYGSNTKWCTTTENSPEYFHKYTKRGVLIYCINKKTGYKVASFYSLDKNEPEFSYWNQKDTRIDSTESELTLELIGFIREYVKTPKVKTNHFMLDDETRKIEEGGGFRKSRTHQLTRRIQDAVRREEDVTQDIPEPIEEEQTTLDRMQLISGTSTTTNMIFSGSTSANTVFSGVGNTTFTTSNSEPQEINVRRED